MTANQYICRICNTAGNHAAYIGREMMFGTKEEFEYFMCGECGCLQIAEIPENPGKYYPATYTPYNPKTRPVASAGWLTRVLQKQRCKTALFNKHYKLNAILKSFVEYPGAIYARPNDALPIGGLLRKAGVRSFTARMLDVGCGAYSHWLACLEEIGFTNLYGVDPLIPRSLVHGKVRIDKAPLSDVCGKFDLITLHHSLEHIPDQSDALTQISQHLAPDGVCLIRIPIVPSRVWDQYKSNWVEFDPPRHLYLHTTHSIKLLASRVGLEVFDVQYDATAFEFYGSEMYARDIPLTCENSPWVNPDSTLFSREEMDIFSVMANNANESKESGRAAFFLRRASA